MLSSDKAELCLFGLSSYRAPQPTLAGSAQHGEEQAWSPRLSRVLSPLFLQLVLRAFTRIPVLSIKPPFFWQTAELLPWLILLTMITRALPGALEKIDLKMEERFGNITVPWAPEMPPYWITLSCKCQSVFLTCFPRNPATKLRILMLPWSLRFGALQFFFFFLNGW